MPLLQAKQQGIRASTTGTLKSSSPKTRSPKTSSSSSPKISRNNSVKLLTTKVPSVPTTLKPTTTTIRTYQMTFNQIGMYLDYLRNPGITYYNICMATS